MDSPRRSSSIPQFYGGRAVFITGATGFMGKVLVERLLATCPNIGRVYLLMREKQGVQPEQRLVALKESPVFDVLRATRPTQLDKLVLVPGDVTKPQLGLSRESLIQLEEVSLVFNSAATVLFHEDLKVAVDQNLMSVIRLMEMCDTLPNIEALIHVSTGYCNPERSYVEEKVYAAPVEVQELLDYVNGRNDIKEEETLKIISPKPNTYTFTKAMAEMALVQRANRRYPVAIFRPTIVVSSLRHPFPGWIENHNGPTSVIVGSATGLFRISWTRSDVVGDILPVDIAIDTLIAVSWETAIDKPRNVRVYNCSSQSNLCTWRRFLEELNLNLVRYPAEGALWYPRVTYVNNTLLFKISEFLLQTLPLYLAEYSGRLLGLKKSRVNFIKVNEKLRKINRALSYFARREWKFAEGNVATLRQRLCEQDRATYNLEPGTIEWKTYLANYVRGTKKYVLKEKHEDLENARKRMQRLYYRHNALKLILFCIVGAIFFSILV